jgi:hypothetical protein
MSSSVGRSSGRTHGGVNCERYCPPFDYLAPSHARPPDGRDAVHAAGFGFDERDFVGQRTVWFYDLYRELFAEAQ